MLALVVVDQSSKLWVENSLPFGDAVGVLPFFSLYRTYNTGIAFSFLSWAGNGGLIVLAFIVLGFMFWLWSRLENHQQLAHLGFALVVAGAFGNIIDRVTQGHVIDFLLFHTQNWAFAVFNLADAFITIGAIAIIVEELLSARAARRRQLADEEN